MDTYGAIDILVSNAAVNPVMGSTLEVEESAWEKVTPPPSTLCPIDYNSLTPLSWLCPL